MSKKNKNKTTGNEEIQQIMEEIKTAQKGDGKVTIDIDTIDENGNRVNEHEETESDVLSVEEMKEKFPDFNPNFEEIGKEFEKPETVAAPEKVGDAPKTANKGVQGVPVAKVEQHPTKHNKPAKNAPKRIEDYEPKEIPDEAMQVYNLMLAGTSEPELKVMYPKWSKRKFKAIITRAKALIAIAVQDKEAAKADVLAKFNHLYNLAYKVGNIKECSRALENIAKINGLTTNLNISDSNFIALWGNQTNVNK
jgi:hypothetical protein